MIKRVSAYEIDGKTFATKSEAEAHLARLRLKELLIEGSVGSGGEWDADMFYSWLIEEGWRLINLFSDIARRGGKPND